MKVPIAVLSTFYTILSLQKYNNYFKSLLDGLILRKCFGLARISLNKTLRTITITRAQIICFLSLDFVH